jgi:hypothetical protein
VEVVVVSVVEIELQVQLQVNLVLLGQKPHQIVVKMVKIMIKLIRILVMRTIVETQPQQQHLLMLEETEILMRLGAAITKIITLAMEKQHQQKEKD